MKRLVEGEPSYYCVNLGSGNLIYLSHAVNVKSNEIIELTTKDIIAKIDSLVDISNAFEQTFQSINTSTEIKNLQDENKVLNEKIIALGDQIAKLVAQIEVLPKIKDTETI